MTSLVRTLGLLAGLFPAATEVFGDPGRFPDYDTAKTCRAQADYAFAATLGQSDVERELTACRDREQENKTLAATFWRQASQKDVAECLGLAEGRYGYLARCLESSRSVRVAR